MASLAGDFRRGYFWRGALVFCVALAVRLAFVSVMPSPVRNDLYWNDAVGWNLAQGNGFTASLAPPYVPGVYRSIGYPAFLALVYGAFGHEYPSAYRAQAVVDAGTAVLVLATASLLLSRTVALAAGLLYAFYPYAAAFCGVLHQDILLVFFVHLSVLLMCWAAQSERPIGRWALVGAAVGAAALVKPFLGIELGAGLLVVLLASRPFGWKWKASAALLLSSAATIAPWLARCYVVFGTFVPLAVGGMVSNLDTVEQAPQRTIEYLRQAALTTRDRASFLAGLPDGHALIAAERSSARAAVATYVTQWRWYIPRMVARIPRLWITRYVIGRGTLVAAVGTATSVALLILGLGGMWLVRRRWRDFLPLSLTLGIITLAYAPYGSEARYTLPARPSMVVFAAVALGWGIRCAARRPEDALPSPAS